MIEVHQNDPKVYAEFKRALEAPSLYDEVLRLLSRRGYGVPAEILERDLTQPYEASKQVTGVWLGVYHNAEKDWDLYELAEQLVDLDYRFQLWRFQHMKTVERIIGYKPGTGGTAGVSYLAKALAAQAVPRTLGSANFDVTRIAAGSGPSVTALVPTKPSLRGPTAGRPRWRGCASVPHGRSASWPIHRRTRSR